MNADEIVRALRTECSDCSERNCCNHGNNPVKYCPVIDAADLIDSLTTQLSASQRREKAAVEELAAHAYAHAASCKHYADCYKVAYAKCAVIRCASCDKYDFCGPQEAEKGDSNER